jgi:hypothetical protein
MCTGADEHSTLESDYYENSQGVGEDEGEAEGEAEGEGEAAGSTNSPTNPEGFEAAASRRRRSPNAS